MSAIQTGPSTAILVLGMHRSGTSALTRVINLLGAHVGDELLGAKADNRKGFWEHAEAVAIHDRLLSSLGRSWHDPRDLPSGWLESPAGTAAVAEVARLIERDMYGRRLWAVKDPRMCRLAPLWIAALLQLRIQAKAVLVVREPCEVASSLHVRDGWSHQHTYLMWAEHLLEALRATADIPRALISYDQLLGDWRTHILRLERQLGITWNPDPRQAGPEIDAFLAPEERHHDMSRTGREIALDRVPPTYLTSLYQACLDTSLDADWFRLVQLDRQFSSVAALFAGPMDEVALQRDEAARLAQDRLEQIQKLARERISFETLALERMERIQQLDAALAVASGQRGAFEALAQERIERIHQLQADLAGVQTIARHTREQLDRLLDLAGSRWWALKRVFRPVKSVPPRMEAGNG